MKLSIIIPVLNEAEIIQSTLLPLQVFRSLDTEIILVDGGSSDATIALSEGLVDRCITSQPGRSLQMNAGADEGKGDYLLFLHSDTSLPDSASELLLKTMPLSTLWGFFPVKLSGRHWLLQWIAKAMNLRSKLSCVATGDQAIFVEKKLWVSLSGYKNIPLMEDVELCKRLRKIARPYVMKDALITSSRRWEDNGIVRTVLLMWYLRFLYFLGADPKALKRLYS